MNKRTARKFIKALRSGDYVQIEGKLCRGVGGDKKPRCCAAGVLGLISGARCVVEPDFDSQEAYVLRFGRQRRTFKHGYDAATQKKLGITGDDETFIIRMNDRLRFTFRSIANVIERKYINGEGGW